MGYAKTMVALAVGRGFLNSGRLAMQSAWHYAWYYADRTYGFRPSRASWAEIVGISGDVPPPRGRGFAGREPPGAAIEGVGDLWRATGVPKCICHRWNRFRIPKGGAHDFTLARACTGLGGLHADAGVGRHPW